MAKQSTSSRAQARTAAKQNYSHVVGTGIPNQVAPGSGTPVTRTSTGADFTHSVKRTPQVSHSTGSKPSPSPSGNW